VFVRIELLRRVLDRPDAASSISLYTDDHARAGAHAAQARAALGSAPARVRPWWEVSELVANAIAGNRAIAAISMTMVVIAVMIPVSALLYILVLHERRQIAILGALGFGRAALFGIYVMKAALIGIAGTALGSGVGLAICRYFAARPIFAHNGFEVRPEVDLPTVAIPVAVLFAVTLCAGIVPAVIAARSNAALELREAE
jgi:lipoprotein-releasing system permease protein